jgi:predicted nucleic acid-binding protein
MKEVSVIPDSSFFICFLDDINKPQQIMELLSSNYFSFIMGKITSSEIQKSKNFIKIKSEFFQKITVYDYFEYSEIVKMFFSESELKKGEHEVFIISFILSTSEEQFIAIVDDAPAKKFCKTNIPERATSITGTVGFVRVCSCTCKVFIKETAIDILVSIKKSKFYVPPSIVDAAIEDIRTC